MAFAARRDGDWHVAALRLGNQSLHHVLREERTVAGKAGEPARVGAVRAHPFEAAEDSGQRPQESADAIGDHLASQSVETLQVAIRIDDEFIDLRPRACNRAFDESLAAQFQERFVRAAHAPRLAARQDQTNCVGCDARLPSLNLNCQNNPTILPSGPTSMASADGTLGSPGMVMISPQIATTNSAPADSLTSRTLIV